MPEVCLQYKNPRFKAFLDSNLHTRLAIVTENELGLAFPPRNLPKKFHPGPSTFYLVIVVTNRQADRQTDRQTNAGKNIIPRFRGDNNAKSSYFLEGRVHNPNGSQFIRFCSTYCHLQHIDTHREKDRDRAHYICRK